MIVAGILNMGANGANQKYGAKFVVRGRMVRERMFCCLAVRLVVRVGMYKVGGYLCVWFR